MSGWIGVDLDGTIAEYLGWKGIEHIGDPIPAMVDRVKRWLAAGKSVKIFTARVSCLEPEKGEAVAYIEAWCDIHLGQKLPVTCIKDFAMIELWDDRAVRVVMNKGIPFEGPHE